MNNPSSCSCPAPSCTGQCAAQTMNNSRTEYFTGHGCPMMNTFNYAPESTQSYYWTFPSAPYPQPATMSFDFSAGSFFPQYNQPFPYYPSCAKLQSPSMTSFTDNRADFPSIPDFEENDENDTLLIPSSTPDSVEHWSPPPDDSLWKDKDDDGILTGASYKHQPSKPIYCASTENKQAETPDSKKIELLMPLRDTPVRMSYFESRAQKLPPLSNSYSLSNESKVPEILDAVDAMLPRDQPMPNSFFEESSKENRHPQSSPHLVPSKVAKEMGVIDLELDSMPVPDASILMSTLETRALKNPFKAEKEKKKRQSPLNRDVAKKCSNCGATESTLWRRTDQGLIECNPCQLHFRRHGQKRPLAMKSTKILRRVRQPRI